jgi:hypothetical protein
MPAYTRTARGKWKDTVQLGKSTISLIRRSPQTLHSMKACAAGLTYTRLSAKALVIAMIQRASHATH